MPPQQGIQSISAASMPIDEAHAGNGEKCRCFIPVHGSSSSIAQKCAIASRSLYTGMPAALGRK